MSKGIRITAISIIMFILSLFIFPVTAKIITVAEQRIVPIIKVGFFSFDGYHDTNADGSKSGYGYEYLKEISKVTGWNYEYIEGTWTQAQKMLEDGEIDLLTSAQKTSEREEKFYFSNLDMGSSSVLLTVKDTNTTYLRNDYDNFNGIKVGMLKGNSRNAQFEKFAEEKGFTYATPQTYDDQLSLELALQNGIVDAIISSSLRKIDGEKIIAKFSPSPFYAIAQKNEGGANIIEQVNLALAEILSRNPDFNTNLYNKYYAGNHGSALALTAEETLYLRQKNVLNVAYIDSLEPLSYYDKKEVKGIDMDIARLMAETLGIQIEFVKGANFSECCDMINDGRADIFFNVASDYSFAEKINIKITSPYKQVQYSAVARKNGSDKIVTVATPKNYYINSSYIRENYSPNNIKEYDSIKECIAAVQNGQADITYVDTYIANEVSKPARSNLQAVVISDLTHNQSIALGINASPILYTLLDRVVISLDAGKVSAIIANNTLLAKHNLTFVEFLYQNTIAVILTVIGIAIIVIAGLILILYMRKRVLKHIFDLAYIDNLSGLWNFNKFIEDGKKLIHNVSSDSYAVISLDIRKFSNINESHGREVGDLVINHCAKVLQKLNANGSIVARIKSDNFVILYKNTGIADINFTIANLSQSLSTFSDNNINIKVKLDFGVYVVCDNNISLVDCVDLAEIARKETKGSKENVIYFDEKFEERLKTQKDIEDRMEQALADGEFAVYYQPKFDMNTAEIVGAEALVRWNSKTRGFMSPIDFIPVFEKNGFITELDFYVLNEVCALLKHWIDNGHKTIPISVNQSRMHFQTKNYSERLQETMKKHGVPYNLIELEVTETAFTDSENIINSVKSLQSCGFRLSVDDFGSGYSSLNLINAVRLDVLKIDKSFLFESQNSKRAQTIIQKIVEMAKDLEMEVICEGVETNEQVLFLLSVGCHLAQGYFFARPMPVCDFKKKFQENMTNVE